MRLASLLFAAPLFCQTLQPPPAPLVFHATSRSLRQVVGMTGSAYLGPARFQDLTFASVSPNQHTAILESAAAGVSISPLNNSTPTPLAEAITSLDAILWSVDSSSAILFSSTTGQIQWLSATGEVQSPRPIPPQSRLLTATQDARTAFYASEGKLYSITAEAQPMLLGLFANPVAAAATPEGDRLFVADQATAHVYELSPGKSSLPLLTEGVDDAAALMLSPDGDTLYVALRTARTIDAYRISDKTKTASLSLDWAPASFERFSDDAYLLNRGAAANEPLSILNTRNGILTQSFIPVGGGAQ